MSKEFFTLSQFALAMSKTTGKDVPEEYLRVMLYDLGIIEHDSSPAFFYSEVCGLCSSDGLYFRELIHDIYETYFRPWCFYGDPPGDNLLDSLTL